MGDTCLGDSASLNRTIITFILQSRLRSSTIEHINMAPKTSGNGLNLVIAFIPTLLSIIYFRWNNVLSIINMNNIDQFVFPHYNSLRPSSNYTNLTVFDQLREEYARACPKHLYKTRIFSTDPLIIYIENFMSAEETDYLVNLAEPSYAVSTVTDVGSSMGVLSRGRKSQTAFLGYDPVCACIAERSASFQGSVDPNQIELLQTVKYKSNDDFLAHWDWAEDFENPRVSTFFAYLACDATENAKGGQCEGGATQFTELPASFSAEWCDVVDCDDVSELGGVLFKAIPANAVFWSNVYPNGTYHRGTLHAGTPVKKGQKIGLNIWTRRDPYL